MKINSKNLTIIQFSIIAVLLILALLWLKSTISRRNTIAREYKNSLNTINVLLTTSKVALTQANVGAFKVEFNEIKKKYENLLSHLNTAAPPRIDLTPLEFKEELLKTEQLLGERANLWSIPIPNAIGFSEYEGGNIPSSKDIPYLMLQLDAMRTLTNFLIESQVQEIKSLVKKGVQDMVISPNQVMYQALSFDIGIETTMDSFQTFLNKIRMSGHLFIIRKIDVEAKKDRVLSMNIQIDNIRLKRES